MEELYCTKCGESLRRAMILALMIDMGASSNRSPEICHEDGESHDWQPLKKEEVKA